MVGPIARRLWVWLRLLGGILLVLLGLIGFFIPIFPNFLFIIPGLVLLSTQFRWARRLLDYIRTRIAAHSAR